MENQDNNFREIDLVKLEEELKVLREKLPGNRNIKNLYDSVSIVNISREYVRLYKAFLHINNDNKIDIILLQNDYFTNKPKMKMIENIEIISNDMVERISK